jgi:glutathione S-transferase
MDKINLKNPMFANHVIAATLMILKAVSMSSLIVVRMMQVKGGFQDGATEEVCLRIGRSL